MQDDEITVAGVGLLGPGTATSTTFTVSVDSASNTLYSGTVTDSTAFSSIMPETFPVDENDSFELDLSSSEIYPLSSSGGGSGSCRVPKWILCSTTLVTA